jgi:hypothetical protein
MEAVKVESIKDIVDNRDATYLLIHDDESTENIEIDEEYYSDIEIYISDGQLYRVIPDEPEVPEVECVWVTDVDLEYLHLIKVNALPVWEDRGWTQCKTSVQGVSHE